MNSATLTWLRTTLGVSLAVGFLWLTLHNLDFNRLIKSAAQIHWPALALALVFLGADYGARSFRWRRMLRHCGGDVTLKSCFWPLIASVAVNNVVPLRAGDILRVISFRDQLKVSRVQILGTVLMERILDLTVLLGFLLSGIAHLGGEENHETYTHSAAIVASVGALVWALLLLARKRCEDVTARLCRHKFFAARGWTMGVERRIREFFATMSVISTPAHALQLLALSLVVWACEGAVFEATAIGLDYDGGLFGPWFALATGTLATLIPSSPGYVGTFDFFTASGLTAYGSSRPSAVAITLTVHLVFWLPLTVAGLGYLVLSNSRASWRRFSAVPLENDRKH